MPIAICDAVPGALVEEYFDDKGARLHVRRKGWIVQTMHEEDGTYATDKVSKVMVLFDKTKGPEESKLRRLNLIRKADEAMMARLKQDGMNAMGDDILSRSALQPVSESPAKDKRTVSQDKTGVGPHPRGMSPVEAEKLK